MCYVLCLCGLHPWTIGESPTSDHLVSESAGGRCVDISAEFLKRIALSMSSRLKLLFMARLMSRHKH